MPRASKVPCVYSPLCRDLFSSKFNRDRHCNRAHQGPSRLWCPKCTSLKFFSSKRSLEKHDLWMHKSDGLCPYCAKQYSGTYLPKHMLKCTQRPPVVSDVTAGDGVEFVSEQSQPLYRPKPTSQTRSSHNAPTALAAETRLEQFWEWLKSPSAAGKSFFLSNPKAYFDKFRTVLGKLAKFHECPRDKFFYKMNRTDSCQAMFTNKKLNDFTMWISKQDNSQSLALRTIYNYLNTLKGFFEWKVYGQGKQSFSEALRLTAQICTNLSLQKDRKAQDIAKKAARLAKLPKMPQFLGLLTQKLKPQVDEVRKKSDFSWRAYEICRDYFLMVLLFGVPPQRKQILERMEDINIATKNKFTVIKVLRRKTEIRYGPVTVLLPPVYMDDFKLFLDIWRDYRTLATHNIFIKANGKADTYLTRHFQRITQREFQVDVSIRDCRSIFINHAKKFFDLTEMYELSRQMCHSFQMQQSEYRADDSIERAFNVLSTMTKHIGDLPLCDMDAAIYQEEREAIAAETELTREDD